MHHTKKIFLQNTKFFVSLEKYFNFDSEPRVNSDVTKGYQEIKLGKAILKLD